jgi:cell division protein FtsB
VKARLDAATRRRALRALLGLFLVLALGQLVFGNMGLLASFKQRHQASLLRREVAEKTAEKKTLEADIVALNRDPFRIETLAREQLGLARPGEIIFQFQPDPSAPPASGSPLDSDRPHSD